jgi:hypothetical protein
MQEIHEVWKEIMDIYKEAEQYNVQDDFIREISVITFDSSIVQVATV